MHDLRISSVSAPSTSSRLLRYCPAADWSSMSLPAHSQTTHLLATADGLSPGENGAIRWVELRNFPAKIGASHIDAYKPLGPLRQLPFKSRNTLSLNHLRSFAIVGRQPFIICEPVQFDRQNSPHVRGDSHLCLCGRFPAPVVSKWSAQAAQSLVEILATASMCSTGAMSHNACRYESVRSAKFDDAAAPKEALSTDENLKIA